MPSESVANEYTSIVNDSRTIMNNMLTIIASQERNLSRLLPLTSHRGHRHNSEFLDFQDNNDNNDNNDNIDNTNQAPNNAENNRTSVLYSNARTANTGGSNTRTSNAGGSNTRTTNARGSNTRTHARTPNSRTLNTSTSGTSRTRTTPNTLNTNSTRHIDPPTIRDIEENTQTLPFGNIENPLYTSCPITHEEFNNNTIVMKINHCGHIFDHASLRNWLTTNNTCPLCRHNIVARSSGIQETPLSTLLNNLFQNASNDVLYEIRFPIHNDTYDS